MFPAVATSTFIMTKKSGPGKNLTRPMATALRVSEARNIGQAFAWAAPPLLLRHWDSIVHNSFSSWENKWESTNTLGIEQGLQTVWGHCFPEQAI